MDRHGLSIRFALLGAFLAIGAPAGWLLLQLENSDHSILHELEQHADLYTYLLLGTGVAFSVFGAAIGLLTDEVRQANAHLRTLTRTDPLTGLHNTRFFHQELDRECARADRDGTPIALIVIDLDHFKRVNDERGHPFGDKALVHVARLMSGFARAADLACRIGGEEFAIICPATELSEGVAIAERIRQAVDSTPVREDGFEWPLTASFGVAVRSPGMPAQAAFRLADAALYQAKARGRNRVEAAAATASAQAQAHA